MSLSVLIPVKDPEPQLPKVRLRLERIRVDNPGLVLEVLEEHSGTLAEARRALVERAHGDFIFNLDADNLVPHEYPARALELLLRDPKIGAVALNYRPKPINHLGFGTSIMRRSVMFSLYDWPGPKKADTCECQYMWRRLDRAGWILATLPFQVYHKRKKRSASIHTERPQK